MADATDPSRLLTVKEVAAYLKVKERTIYDLVRQGRIPGSRVTGKWLFPLPAVEAWVQSGMRGEGQAAQPPPVVAGSHDPLLEWALRESDCGLALLPGGSLDGLRRFAEGQAQVCALHLLDVETGTYNIPALQVAGPPVLQGSVVLRWALRQQGLMLPKGNPRHISGIADLAEDGLRLAAREASSGTHRLFGYLLQQVGLKAEQLTWLPRPYRTHSELALAVLEGQADAGLGVEGAAHQLGLDFLPLHQERFDLVVRRRDAFEPPFQRLLAFTRSPAFAEKVASLTGYDVQGLGRVEHNGP